MRKSQRQDELVLKALGDAIRNRRVDLELTQEEVAAASNLHRTYVTDIENGLRNISYLTLIRVVKALECPLSHLILKKEEILDSWSR